MTAESDIAWYGLQTWQSLNDSAGKAIHNHEPHETLTAAGAASIWGITVLNSASAACNATLADGEMIGQIKTFVMSNASNSSTVTVAHHITSDPEVFTFAQVGDTLVLLWDGTDWITLVNVGAAT